MSERKYTENTCPACLTELLDTEDACPICGTYRKYFGEFDITKAQPHGLSDAEVSAARAEMYRWEDKQFAKKHGIPYKETGTNKVSLIVVMVIIAIIAVATVFMSRFVR